MSRLRERYSVSDDPQRSERRVELAVLVLVALLLVQVVWGIYAIVFPSRPEPVMPTAESLQVGELQGTVLVTPEQRAQMRQRPVFWASRQPAEGEPEAVEQRVREKQTEKKPGEISGVKLSGVFGAGESAGIIVLAEGKKRRVMVGDTIKGWTLDSVTPVEATFSREGREASLQLERGKPMQIVPAEAEPQGRAGPEFARPAPPRELPDTLTLGGGARDGGKKTN